MSFNERRARLYGYQVEADPAKASNILKFQDGQIRQGIQVHGQVLTLDFSQGNYLYPDDVLPLIWQMIDLLNKNNPDSYNSEAIELVKQAIYAMDKRAVARHGFKNSPEEASVPVPY